MINYVSQRGGTYAVLIIACIATLVGLLGFVYLKSSNMPMSPLSSMTADHDRDGWLTYRSDELPYSFDYPKEWQVSQESKRTHVLSSDKGEKVAVIQYLVMPRGMTRGVALCQVRQASPNDHCSYIDNDLVGYFYGSSKEDGVWRGMLKDPSADIILRLLAKDHENMNLLLGVAESIRPRS